MLLSLLSLLACSPAVTEASWRVSPHVEMAGSLEWSSAEVGRPAVQVSGAMDHSWQTDFGEEGDAHSVPVLGMRGGQRYTLTPLLELPDGEVLQGEPVEVTQALPPLSVRAGTIIGDWPEGFLVTHLVLAEESAAVIFDPMGLPVWTWAPEREFDTRIISAGLTPDGESLSVSDIRDATHELAGHLATVSFDGETLIDFPGDDLHHHPVVTPEGTWGAFQKVEVELLDHGTVLYDRLVEVDPSTGEVRVLFDPLEHFEVQQMCDTHWELVLPATDGAADEPVYDWTHANSVVLSPDEQGWLIMFRHWDNVIRIDRATGAIDWFLGGPYDTLGLDPLTPQAFAHAHFSEATEDHILIFDNHLHRGDGHSRVVKYAIDADAPRVDLTFELWDFEHGALEWLGDAITLPDGTMMISWTDQGRVTWHDPDGALRGEMMMPIGAATGRISYLPTLP